MLFMLALRRCRFLLEHASELGGVLDSTVQDLGAPPRHPCYL